MSKAGKKYEAAKKQIEPRPYTVEDAMGLLKKVHYAKFNETIEVHMRLGVDPKHADQMVRGTLVLPHGIGKSKTVCVIASGAEASWSTWTSSTGAADSGSAAAPGISADASTWARSSRSRYVMASSRKM